jgi:hypothetical protein
MIRMTELQVEVTHRADAGRPVPCQDGTAEIETTPADRIERGAVREIGRAEVGPVLVVGVTQPKETR